MDILDRVMVRLSGESLIDEPFLLDASLTIIDRLNLRLGTEYLPVEFKSIAVDAVIKVWRRKYYEGIESERIDIINTSFVDNILDEYREEIYAYINDDDKESSRKNVVEFL